mmetsp:Transcript_31891/g.70876  ORF Transcript_31891/g.70876 Transcript_31891/m.70876 type:complete len:226 (-) Transcript_31891:359-1036(-)
MLLSKLGDKVGGQDLVEQVGTELMIPVHILDLKLRDLGDLPRFLGVVRGVLDQGNLSAARAHVIEDNVVGLVAEVTLNAILQSCSSVRVDEAQHIHASHVGSIKQGLALCLAKVCRHCNDSIWYAASGLVLRDLLGVLEDAGHQLLCRVDDPIPDFHAGYSPVGMVHNLIWEGIVLEHLGDSAVISRLAQKVPHASIGGFWVPNCKGKCLLPKKSLIIHYADQSR